MELSTYKSLLIGGALLVAVVLGGWGLGVFGSPELAKPVASTEPPMPAPDPVNQPQTPTQQTAPVVISLDEEARLQSPIRTLVTNRRQAYTLNFLEAMNRASVEKAIQNQLKATTEDGTGQSIHLQLSYTWDDDKKLHVVVEVPELEMKSYYLGSYHISVEGALTQAGKTLEQPAVFSAVLTLPNQLWRMSVDGKVREVVAPFKEPHTLSFLGKDQRYLLLSRYTNFCQCDAHYPRLYSVYDVQSEKLTAYPTVLMTRYVGEGSFVADQRGFFYEILNGGTTPPIGDTAKSLHIDGYIHGANFSKDYTHILMAVGSKEQKADYDLVVYNFKTGEQQRLAQALKGSEPPDFASGSMKIPVYFEDDGQYVYFTMYEKTDNGYKTHPYRYSWESKSVSAWTPPAAGDQWTEFKDSSDGLYRLYRDPNHGLYKNGQQVSQDMNLYQGYWLNGTHLIARLNFDDQASEMYRHTLELFDADKNKAQTIAKNLPTNAELIGTSANGKWVYFSSNIFSHKN